MSTNKVAVAMFVVVFGLLMITTTAIVLPTGLTTTYLAVAKKKQSSDSGGGGSSSGSSSGSDKGSDSGGSSNSGGGTSDTGGGSGSDSSTPKAVDDGGHTPASPVIPVPPSDNTHNNNDGSHGPIARIPEQGWVKDPKTGKWGWTGGSPDDFKNGPPRDIPIHRPLPPVIKEIININLIIKKTGGHSSGSSGSSHTSGYTMTAQQYEIMKLVWMNGIKRGQYPEIDKIVDECLGITA